MKKRLVVLTAMLAVAAMGTMVNAEGEKCERCWKYRKLGEHAGHETICSDCYSAVVE